MVNYWKQWAIWWRKSKIKGKMVGAWANYIILGTIIGRTNDRANNEGYGVEAFVWDHKPPKISWIFLAPPMQENPCPMDRFRRRSRHAAMWPVEHAGLVQTTWRTSCRVPKGGTRAEGLNSRNGLQPQAQPRQPCGSSLGLLWRAITCTKRMRSECLNKAITRLSHVVRLHSSNIWLSSQSYPIATPILACKPARQQIFQTTSPPTIPLGRRSEAASLLRS